MTRALVTGAAGFVGSNLARRLIAEGHEVHLAAGPGADTWRLDGLDAERSATDLTDAASTGELVARAQPEWIFHLAAHGAYSWQTDSRRIAAVNVVGTANLLEAAFAHGFSAFVNAGTSSEYGLKANAPTEDEPLDPNSAYAATKAASTMLLRQASLAHAMPIVTLRLYSAYGPWEDTRRLIPALILAGLDGRLPPLVDPSTARDFVHIDDIVEAFVLAASTPLPPGSVFNIASGTQTTIGGAVEVARRVFAIEDMPVWGSLPPRSWDTSTWVGDASKAGRELGWRPSRDFESGFRLTVDWARGGGWP